ncbi:hypothetical protein I7I51_08363 [Histoplasma capsulatum]|uniref:Uncharacterized protein n=1 Tax=Ajellomyces capsulatus TaxID=5037 RepID=A0A8A1M2E5_AJECA|nr:hypothetical protein I7I51_08363 [Histoplasma capsulatum]
MRHLQYSTTGTVTDIVKWMAPIRFMCSGHHASQFGRGGCNGVPLIASISCKLKTGNGISLCVPAKSEKFYGYQYISQISHRDPERLGNHERIEMNYSKFMNVHTILERELRARKGRLLVTVAAHDNVRDSVRCCVLQNLSRPGRALPRP